MAYPYISDYLNEKNQSRAIVEYNDTVAQIDKTEYDQVLAQARAYNKALIDNGNRWVPTEEDTKEYLSLLNVGGTGIMGYVEIAELNISLPIYHSTAESVLQVAIGHLQGSSLPVGGESTHTVISGHTGLPSAKLFTEIDRLEIGDTFLLKVLDNSLLYEVEKIQVILPTEMNILEIEPGRDLCTLVTCTPYGVNSHRLLVQGKRIENPEVEETIPEHVPSNATKVNKKNPLVFLEVLFVVITLILVISHFTTQRAKRKYKKADKGDANHEP